MTESELQLELLAQSVASARRQAGCRAAAAVPAPPATEILPAMGGEVQHDECLVSMLASGSKGNAAFIRCAGTNILIDAGISCRRIAQGLQQYGCTLRDLDALFITHEHTDHVNGLATLLKRTDMPVYTTKETWSHIGRSVDDYQNRFVPLTRRVRVGGIQVVPFSISHDAARPVGYTVYHGSTKITLATDLGCLSPEVEQAAAYADILILEANHDEEMLKNGPYPYALQQRILGPWGHLSNRTAAEFLASLPMTRRMHVLLAHRSEKNNTPFLSLHTVRQVLAQKGRVVGEDILLRLACQRGRVRFQQGGTELCSETISLQQP